MAGININKANLKELTKLPGVGSAMAERIIRHRERIGEFKETEDLEHVSGISASMMRRLKDLVAVTDNAEPAGVGSLTVDFTDDAGKGDYNGYRVAVVGNRINENEVSIPFAATAFSSTGGRTELSLPSLALLDGSLQIEVYTPDGQIVHSESRAAKDLPQRLELKVPSRNYGITQPNLAVSAGKPKRIKGRVFDESGKAVPELQVVVWASKANNPEDKDFFALFVAATDMHGHFSGPYPLGTYSAAHATVAVQGDTQSIQIHLEDGQFPESVILPVDLPCPETFDGDDSCSEKGKGEPPLKVDRPTGEKVEVDARQPEGDGTLASALADLFGLGGEGKPAKRPNRIAPPTCPSPSLWSTVSRRQKAQANGPIWIGPIRRTGWSTCSMIRTR